MKWRRKITIFIFVTGEIVFTKSIKQLDKQLQLQLLYQNIKQKILNQGYKLFYKNIL